MAERLRRRIATKERRGHFVDRRVGALGGEYDRNQKLEGILVYQRTFDIGIGRCQMRGDGARSRPSFRASLVLAPVDFRDLRRDRAPLTYRV